MSFPHKSIPILRVKDAPAAVGWYQKLGFREDWRFQYEPGYPWFISVSTPEGATIFLTEHEGDCSFGGTVFLVTNDIANAEIALGVKAQKMPWGDLQLSVIDLDGNGVRVSQPGDR